MTSESVKSARGGLRVNTDLNAASKVRAEDVGDTERRERRQRKQSRPRVRSCVNPVESDRSDGGLGTACIITVKFH